MQYRGMTLNLCAFGNERVRDNKKFALCLFVMLGSSSPAYTPGNLRSQISRTQSTVAWDKHSPVKTVGKTTSIPSSQASPALVNALFERVEEQAEVTPLACY